MYMPNEHAHRQNCVRNVLRSADHLRRRERCTRPPYRVRQRGGRAYCRSPTDALKYFDALHMDLLILGNVVEHRPSSAVAAGAVR
jgi:hypothetical protein